MQGRGCLFLCPLMLSNCGAREDSCESLGQQGDPTRPSGLNIHWKDQCWSWNSITLASWWEELTHLKRPGCWERVKAGGERVYRGWDGRMASPAQWTWVWVNFGSWWWTGRSGLLQSMGLQRIRHDWATELNWLPHLYLPIFIYMFFYILPISKGYQKRILKLNIV